MFLLLALSLFCIGESENLDFVLIFHCCRESEGNFYFGNYNYEADDLHSVIRYFTNMNRVVPIIIGHSKRN